MNISSQFDDGSKFNVKFEMKGDSENYFDLCQKCSSQQSNVKDWMKHLVDRHPLPIRWMSDDANYLTGDKVLKPYTIVTESRKKRKKHITPRPLNSFMIFSRHLRRNVLLFFSDASNSEISKLLGKLWNSISTPIKSMYDSEAKKLALLHSQEFPDYKYQPKKKKKQHLNTKRNVDNCTPLSNTSYESVADNVCSLISDVARKSDSNIKRESNSASVSSFGSVQDTRTNLFINHYSKSNNFSGDESYKPIKKASRRSHQLMIASQIMEDSEGAESSPSSFKNTIKRESISLYSPIINNYQNNHLSDNNFSSLANFIKQNDEITILPKIDGNILQDLQTRHRANITSFKQQNNFNMAVDLTTPLTIVTEKIDEPDSFQQSKVNMRFVKISRSQVQPDSGMLPRETSKLDNSLGNNYYIDSNNFRTTNQLILDLDQKPIIVNRHVPNTFIDRQMCASDQASVAMSRKRTNLDPLIIDDIFENDDNFDYDDTCLYNVDNHNSSPWSFKSPNFKLSTGSSNLSDNPCKDTFGSSPFHLSEHENHPAPPIQRLPAIGSWLRSNYSEFMI